MVGTTTSVGLTQTLQHQVGLVLGYELLQEKVRSNFFFETILSPFSSYAKEKGTQVILLEFLYCYMFSTVAFFRTYYLTLTNTLGMSI